MIKQLLPHRGAAERQPARAKTGPPGTRWRPISAFMILLVGCWIHAVQNQAFACPAVSRPPLISRIDLVGDWTEPRQLDIRGSYVEPLNINFESSLVDFDAASSGAYRMKSRGTAGFERVTVSVSDSTSCTPSTQIFFVIVRNNNTRPAFSTFPIATLEGEPSEWYTVAGTDPDPGPGGLSFSVSGVSSTEVLVEQDGMDIRIVPSVDYEGTGSFTGTLCDSYGSWNSCVSKTFAYTVDNTNDPPMLQPLSLATPASTTSPWYTPVVDDPDPRDVHTASIVAQAPSAEGVAEVSGVRVRFVPAAGFVGISSFRFLVCDRAGACSDPVIAAVTVAGIGSPPTFIPPEIPIAEDGNSGWLGLSIADPDPADTHRASVSVQPVSGRVDIDASNRIRDVPQANFFGTDSFTIAVCDRVGNCVDGVSSVSVQARNDAPFASDAVVSTLENTASRWVAIEFTDYDPGDSHSIAIVTAPAPSQGRVEWRTVDPRDPDLGETHTLRVLTSPDPAHGTLETRGLDIRFAPAANWYGAESFTFEVCDAHAACSPPVAGQIAVTPVGDPPTVAPISVATVEDTPSDPITVSVSDIDVDDVHTIALDQPIAEAELAVSGLTFTLVPKADYAGSFTFGLRTCDLYENCVVTVVPVTVSPVNDVPQVADISMRGVQDTTTPWTVVEIRDPDQGDTHTLEIIAHPTNGTVEVNATAFRYTPPADWTGDVSFAFRVCDSTSACSGPASGSLRVLDPNDPPTVEPFTLTAVEDSPSPWHSVEVNDPDAYDSHTLEVAQSSPDGQVELRGLDVRFVPKNDFSGSTAFALRLCDTEPHCIERTIDVTVTPVNDAPGLAPLTLATTQEDLPTGWQTVQITDPDDGDTHVLEVSTSPAQGSVELNGADVRYVPAPHWSGGDRFALRVCDAGGLCSQPIDVAVTVRPNNDPPEVAGGSIVTAEDAVSDWLDLAPMVSDPDPGDTYTISVVSSSRDGVVSIDGTRMRFTPAADFTGNTQFTYQACDAVGACSAAAPVTVTVTPQNDRPNLGNLDLDTTEDLATAWIDIPVLDPDEADAHNFTVVAQGQGGRAEVLDSTVRFVPDPGWYGDTQFTLQVCDVGALCSSRQYDVAVGFFNDPPSVDNVSIVVDEDTPSDTIALALSDPDPTDLHTLTVPGSPRLGTVRTIPEPVGFVYTPNANVNGNDAFTIKVCDLGGLCAEADVTVEIRATNDAPQSVALVLLTKQDRATPFVVPRISDPDEGDTHTLSILTQPAGGSVELGSDGLSVRGLPNPGFAGPDQFRVRVCDAADACLEATAEFRVIPAVSVDRALGTVRIPRVAGAVPLADARWPFTSERIKSVDTGQLLSGVRDIRVEYSGDAVADLDMNGTVISRGDVITIAEYDFNATAGRVILPLALVDPASAPTGYIGTLRVYVPDFYATDVAADVVVWDPLEDIEIGAPDSNFVRKVESIALPARDSGINCGSPIVVWTGAAGFAYANKTRSYCAVEWTSLPSGVAQDPTKPSPLLRGYINDPSPSATFGWRAGVVYFGSDGAPYFLPGPGEATLDVAVTDPAPPQISYEPVGQLATAVNWVADGEWPTNVGPNVYAGVVRARAQFNGLSIQITSPDGSVRDFAGSRDLVQGALYTALADIGDSAGYAVRASYVRYPEIESEAAIRLTAGPIPPRIVLARPEGIVNTSDTILSGNLGSYNSGTGQFTFNETANGSWMVQAYEAKPDRTYQPLGGSVAISAADGRFQLNLGRLEPRTYRIVVKGHLVTNKGMVTDALTTSPTSVRVADGSPVNIVLSAYREAGKIPFAASIKASLSDVARGSDIGEVVWESSDDGTAFSVVDRGERYRRALGLSQRIETEGARYYRCTTVNKHTGERFVSAVFRVNAYRVPKFTLSGYRYTFLDNAVTWTLATEDSAPIEYLWQVRKNDPRAKEVMEAAGDTISLSADRTGTWYVMVKARYQAAPDTQYAWATLDSTLVVSAPFIQAPLLTGPAKVEVGSTYSFSVDTSRVLDKRFAGDLVVRGMWRFPDGTSAAADTVDYTIKRGDKQVEYVAWVEGYEQEARVVTTKRFDAWEYAWPEFVLYKRSLRDFIPASNYYAINTASYSDKAGLGQELLTYTFDLPDGGAIESHERNTAVMRFTEAGTYRVVATVSDTRGNTQSLYDEIVVQPPPPLVASLSAISSDGWGRVPLYLTLRWYINGLIPYERVNNLRVYLDGKLIHEGVTTYLRHKVETVGTHTLLLEIETSEGRSARSETTFDAIEGAPPTCDVSISGDGVRSLGAQGICVTLMGRITGYHWWLEYADTGQVSDLGVRGQSIYIPSSSLPRGIKSITLVGVNDKGHESDPVTWSSPSHQ